MVVVVVMVVVMVVCIQIKLFFVFSVHFPISPFLQSEENNRIKGCEGGYVANGRVMGNLAVCRIVMLAGGLCSRMQP